MQCESEENTQKLSSLCQAPVLQQLILGTSVKKLRWIVRNLATGADFSELFGITPALKAI
jgi:hypothetical protein